MLPKEESLIISTIVIAFAMVILNISWKANDIIHQIIDKRSVTQVEQHR